MVNVGGAYLAVMRTVKSRRPFLSSYLPAHVTQ